MKIRYLMYKVQNSFQQHSVPDLSLCLGEFCLCGAILNFKAFCFGAIPDIMIELRVYLLQPSGLK